MVSLKDNTDRNSWQLFYTSYWPTMSTMKCHERFLPQLSEIEQVQALVFLAKNGMHESKLQRPSNRSKIALNRKNNWLRLHSGVLLDIEKSIETLFVNKRRQTQKIYETSR